MLIELVRLREVPVRGLRLIGVAAAQSRGARVLIVVFVGPLPNIADEIHHAKRTRAARMRIADAAEARFGRKIAWGAECGDERALFTSLSVPVMTRLRMPERRVLDTLVNAGVARSRSDALAWCVRLVRTHEGEWIDELRDALVHVEAVRARGPGGDTPDS